MRESESLWAYPAILFLHTMGLAFLVGTSVAMSLRILASEPGAPLAPMEQFFPVMYFGFWVNALSGVALSIAHATLILTQPTFWIKMAFIAVAVVNIRLLKTQVFRDPASLDARPALMKGKVLAGTSLALWAGAITAGRLTAYLGSITAPIHGAN